MQCYYALCNGCMGDACRPPGFSISRLGADTLKHSTTPSNTWLDCMKRIFVSITLVLCGLCGHAQAVLSLDSCRAMALRNNKELAQSKAQLDKAHWDTKAAHTNYLPKVSLTAGYMRTGDEISLLSNNQKNALNNIGTTAVNQFGAQFPTIAQQIITKYPDLAPLIQDISGTFQKNAAALGQAGNAFGKGITDAFRTDTRNMTAGMILLTQPLYMGGKIKAYENITKHQVSLADAQLRADEQQVMLDVDRAYWQVVSLANKRRLAVSYRNMLAHLDSDVVKMINEGVATKSNELSVSVKLNEAEMTLMKVEDGLTLSRMLLCQLCGLPLESAPRLADEDKQDLPTVAQDIRADVETAYANRAELSQLATAQQIYAEKAKIERAAVLPQIALTGGYMISNPNVFNGFEKKFRGTWAVGVMLKVPVWNWGETKYKVRAARTEATIAALKTDEAREKIELQVNQEAFKVNEANRKLTLSMKNLDKAEENLRTAQVGFKEGVITTSDLLAAQTAWLQAHSDKIDAQIDIKLSHASYNKALGQLGE